MKKFLLLALVLPSFALATPPIEDPSAGLRNAALADDRIAWDIIEGLTTEVGQRMAGTEAEEHGRQWAVRKLTELGFSNVHVEPFEMAVWVRGEERAEIVSPFPQRMAVTALGNSGATPARGIEAEVIGFESVAALEAASDESVRGRIVFVTHAMAPTQDGSSYGAFGAPRRQGPSVASRKGAAAIVVRSIGTDYHRNPHTGVQSFAEGVRPIPAGALSIPDAEQLQRILDRGRPVRMRLTLTPRNIGRRQSGNVIAEVPGSDPNAGVILAAISTVGTSGPARSTTRPASPSPPPRRIASCRRAARAGRSGSSCLAPRKSAESAATLISSATAMTATSFWSANRILAPIACDG